MTVAQLSRDLTQEELVGWAAYYAIKGEEEEKAMDRSRMGRGAKTMVPR